MENVKHNGIIYLKDLDSFDEFPGEYVIEVGSEAGKIGHIYAEVQSFMGGESSFSLMAFFPQKKFDSDMLKHGMVVSWNFISHEESNDDSILVFLGHCDGGYDAHKAMKESFEYNFGVKCYMQDENGRMVKILASQCEVGK